MKNLQDKTLLPEWPFGHSDLARSDRLVVLDSMTRLSASGIRTPSVIFAAHPSLRCGDAVHLMTLLGKHARNTVILTGIVDVGIRRL